MFRCYTRHKSINSHNSINVICIYKYETIKYIYKLRQFTAEYKLLYREILINLPKQYILTVALACCHHRPLHFAGHIIFGSQQKQRHQVKFRLACASWFAMLTCLHQRFQSSDADISMAVPFVKQQAILSIEYNKKKPTQWEIVNVTFISFYR